MKHIARTLALALLGVGLSHAAENAPPTPKIPMEARIKEAARPFSWNQIDFMSVPKGKEDAYEAVERDWKKIHDELARRGKLINWTVWKAEDPAKAGFDYATVKTFDCVADTINVYDWDEIAQFYGKDKLQELFDRTAPTRTLARSELWRVEDYTLATSNKGDRKRAYITMMKAKDGKQQEYEAMEKDIYGKVWQQVAQKQPGLAGWMFHRLVSFTGSQPAYDYYTSHLVNTDMPQITEEQRNKAMDQAWKDAGVPAMDKVKPENLRTELRTFSVQKVLETSPDSNPIRNQWSKLTGTWKATNADGSYRTKKITPHWEEVEEFKKDGTSEFKAKIPMKVEVREGLYHFYSLHEWGTWHSIYNIHDGVWYEQSRGIFADGQGKPNDFFIYRKIQD